jgi:Domain of Unknown Function (DUF1259)
MSRADGTRAGSGRASWPASERAGPSYGRDTRNYQCLTAFSDKPTDQSRRDESASPPNQCTGTAMRKPIHLTVAMLTLGLTSPALATEADWEGVEKALGVPGSMEPGDVYKVSLPRSDLKVTADGVPVKAAFALGSWLAFKQAGEHTMVMGDLVLTGDEVNPVISKLEEGGIQVTALHHHLDNLKPDVLFMHVSGMGRADGARPGPARRSGDEQDAARQSVREGGDGEIGAGYG